MWGLLLCHTHCLLPAPAILMSLYRLLSVVIGGVQVPGWFGFVPVTSIEAAGSKVMGTTLNLMVPRFLEQLQKDYKQWASGDESRKPVGEL